MLQVDPNGDSAIPGTGVLGFRGVYRDHRKIAESPNSYRARAHFVPTSESNGRKKTLLDLRLYGFTKRLEVS